ncbi:hypothetical protein D3C76_1546000 [compost metagenome]
MVSRPSGVKMGWANHQRRWRRTSPFITPMEYGASIPAKAITLQKAAWEKR